MLDTPSSGVDAKVKRGALHEKVILPKFVGVRKYVINSEAI